MLGLCLQGFDLGSRGLVGHHSSRVAHICHVQQTVFDVHRDAGAARGDVVDLGYQQRGVGLHETVFQRGDGVSVKQCVFL